MAEMQAAVAQAQVQQGQVAQEREMRTRLERHARTIGVSDGTSRDGVRTWVEAIDNAKTWTGASDGLILDMVGYLAQGALANLILTHLEGAGQAQRTWDSVKAAITSGILSEDEAEWLRKRVSTMTQRPYEDSREYGRRFQEAVRKAYSQQELNMQVVRETVVGQFVNGLRDRSVRTQVYLSRPQDLVRAVDLANQAARAVSLAEGMDPHRQEEPMEVAALPSTQAELRSGELVTLLKSMKGQLDGLQSEVAKLKSGSATRTTRGQQPGTSNQERGRQNPAQGVSQGRTSQEPQDNSNRRCFKCRQTGHFKRDCPLLRAQIAQRAVAALEAMAAVDRPSEN